MIYVDGCTACTTQQSNLGNVADILKEVNLYQINVKENEELADLYGIRSIPTFLLWKVVKR